MDWSDHEGEGYFRDPKELAKVLKREFKRKRRDVFVRKYEIEMHWYNPTKTLSQDVTIFTTRLQFFDPTRKRYKVHYGEYEIEKGYNTSHQNEDLEFNTLSEVIGYIQRVFNKK